MLRAILIALILFGTTVHAQVTFDESWAKAGCQAHSAGYTQSECMENQRGYFVYMTDSVKNWQRIHGKSERILRMFGNGDDLNSVIIQADHFAKYAIPNVDYIDSWLAFDEQMQAFTRLLGIMDRSKVDRCIAIHDNPPHGVSWVKVLSCVK